MHHTPRSTFHVPRSTSHIWLWLGMALIVGLFYLAMAYWGYGFFGFPLDDAWIHQTYARNLAWSGQLAFVPGIPSAGSTAPLWTMLLSLGYLWGISFQGWTYGLGIVLLGLTGWTVAQLGQRLFPEHRNMGWLAGLFCLFEWHLVWAAVSGMETLLFVWLSLLLVDLYLAGKVSKSSRTSRYRDVGLGIVTGLLILTRPEGLGLLGLIGLDMAWCWWRNDETGPIPNLFSRWFMLVLGAGLLLIPYMLWHWQTTGLLFPNTLYAKQAEYGLVLQTFPLWWRLFGSLGPSVETVQGVFRVIFIGAQVLLLPGLILAVWLTVKEHRWELVLIWLWWISYLVLYAFRLPVTYQHGRYQMPVIVWFVLLGVWGTARLVELLRKSMVGRVVRGALVVSLGLLLLGFTVIGAQAYGRDVGFIESEMVATARWLDANIAPNALVAAHDIGAIGYFSQRPLIDLAGLVTPDVIPFIRDENQLTDFMIAQNADYLVTFPSWYPRIIINPQLKPVYHTQAGGQVDTDSDNMTVYEIYSD